jgi:hypothetical protein
VNRAGLSEGIKSECAHVQLLLEWEISCVLTQQPAYALQIFRHCRPPRVSNTEK